MKAVVFASACKANDLKITDNNPIPEIKEDEILIQVHAFGLNFADIIARKGQYDEAPPFPFIPVAGVVKEVGEKVDNHKVGDKVKDDLLFSQKVLALTDFGGYAEYAKTRAIAAFPLPEGWTFAQGAAVMVVNVTAYHSLHHTGTLFEGDRVVIHSAAGGLGLASIELALHAKCKVIGICGNAQKCELIRAKGVEAIDLSKDDYVQKVMELTDKEGVDIVLDPVGGRFFKKGNGRVIGLGGAFSVGDGSLTSTLQMIPGVLSMITLSSISMMLQCKSFCGVNLKRIADEKPQLLVKSAEGFLKLFNEGVLEAPQPKEFPWEQIGQVQEDMEARKTTGKMVMIINHEEGEEEGKSKEEEKE